MTNLLSCNKDRIKLCLDVMNIEINSFLEDSKEKELIGSCKLLPVGKDEFIKVDVRISRYKIKDLFNDKNKGIRPSPNPK